MKKVQEHKTTRTAINHSGRNQARNTSNASFSETVIKYIEDQLQHPFFTEQAFAEMTYLNDHIAYIDNVIGLHRVANVQSEAAITLHIYT